jgi:hypothetical protein
MGWFKKPVSNLVPASSSAAGIGFDYMLTWRENTAAGIFF